MEVKFNTATAKDPAVVAQGQPLSAGEVLQKNKNIITFIYSLNHELSEEQIKDFLNFAKINYTTIDIIPVIVNDKKVSINADVYNDVKLVCKIVSLHSIDIDLQNKLANIPSNKHVDYIISLANTIVSTIQYSYPVVDYFYYGGQSTMAMYLNLKVNDIFSDVNCIEPTTDRISIDNPDGTKVSTFKHHMWRSIFLIVNNYE